MGFKYIDNELHCISGNQSVNLPALVGDYQGPVYVYNLNDILERLAWFQSNLPDTASIHFAMKSNHNPIILKQIAKLGFGVDLVSGGELQQALDAGFDPKKIVFSGVGKSKQEITFAIENQIKQINVESPQELERIGQLAKSLQKPAAVAFRMNPDVDPDTHPYIKTGFRDNKFGMDESFLFELEALLKTYSEHLNLVGLTLHIGSQIKDITTFRDAIVKTRPLYEHFKGQGHPLIGMDIGGGLGISYENDGSTDDLNNIKLYCEMAKSTLSDFDGQILCEPGRMIVARSGVLITQVQYLKESPYKKFAIVDTGMHHLMRPCLYEAFHRIMPLKNQGPKAKTKLYDIVGPICESSDVIGFDRNLPELKQDDLLAIMDVGAYGYVMANTYNSHKLPKEVVLFDGKVIS